MKRLLQRRFLWTLTSLVVVVTLALPWVVFADNVVNDVVVGGTDTFTLGGSTTVSYKIVGTGGDGQPGCNASDGSAATVTINAPTGVTATPGTLTFTTCNDFKPVVFTASAAGDYSITVSVSDSGPGSYHTTPAAFTLHVLAPADTTPPVIVPTVSPAPNAAGWNNSDVTVSWSVTDPESGIASSTGCGTTTLTAETAGTPLTCQATNGAGLSNSASVTVKIDKTPPTFGACPAGGPFLLNSGLQLVGPISVDAAISGLNAAASTLSGSVDTSSIGAKTVTFTAVDNAGNEATKDCEYRVIYNWNGFFRPVDNPGLLNVFNVAKAGSAIPVKFSLSGNQGLSIFAAGYPKSTQITCDTAAPNDGIEETLTAGGSSLSYDPLVDQYIYVWKTDKAWAGTCRLLTVRLIDGTDHRANFKFTK